MCNKSKIIAIFSAQGKPKAQRISNANIQYQWAAPRELHTKPNHQLEGQAKAQACKMHISDKLQALRFQKPTRRQYKNNQYQWLATQQTKPQVEGQANFKNAQSQSQIASLKVPQGPAIPICSTKAMLTQTQAQTTIVETIQKD